MAPGIPEKLLIDSLQDQIDGLHKGMTALRTDLARVTAERDQAKFEVGSLSLLMEMVREDRDRCVEALRPWAAWAKRIDADESACKFSDGCPLSIDPERLRLAHHVTLGHLRAAAALVAEMDAKGGTHA